MNVGTKKRNSSPFIGGNLIVVCWRRKIALLAFGREIDGKIAPIADAKIASLVYRSDDQNLVASKIFYAFD
jgi:hypothetical protein